jgi:phosphoglycolate phosphatase
LSLKLVIFDCDGTLVDSQEAIFAAMALAFADHGLALPERHAVLAVVGLSLPQAIQALLPNHPAPLVLSVCEAFKGAFGRIRLEPQHQDPLFPGAREAVPLLAGRAGVVLGVATGKSLRGVRHLFEREGWHPHFATIQTADNSPSKPDPGMVLQAMAETGAEPEHTVMIGDTSFDTEMARAAGVHAVGVAWGYHPVAALERAGAHVIVEDYAGLLAHLGRWLDGDDA